MQYTCVLNAKKKNKKKKEEYCIQCDKQDSGSVPLFRALLYREYSVTQSVFRLIDVDRQ